MIHSFHRFTRHPFCSILLTGACLLWALLACKLLPGPAEPQVKVPTQSPSATTRPSATPTFVLPTPTEFPQAILAAELEATLNAELTPTTTPDGHGFAYFPGIEGVNVFALENGLDGRSLWVAFSQGIRAFEPPQKHFVALYTRDSFEWREISRLQLSDADYYSEWAVEQVNIEPDHLWLQAQGGAGAHGGCYDLLSFDGKTLHEVLSNCASTPLAGELRDLNGDGTPEVLLNLSENYVFCYACGVRIWVYQVWRWDGTQMVEVQLTRLPRPTQDELSRLNDRAVELAQSELWKDAHQTIQQAIKVGPENDTIRWNAALINLHADSRAKWTGSDSPYPLLSRVFYGDYASALEIMRPYQPEHLFTPQTPLVTGTVAEGWNEALKDWITLFTNKAIQTEPNLAAAYFLRGWAAYLVNPGSAQATADILHAAQLDPHEPLFAQSAAYLESPTSSR